MFFKDPILQKAFDTDGFVRFPLLDESEVHALNDLYDHSFSSNNPGFYSSSFLADESQRALQQPYRRTGTN